MPSIIARLRARLPSRYRYLDQSRVRRCGCCERLTVVVSRSDGEEFKTCVRCHANLRYEMLARYIRTHYAHLGRLDVLELDPRSPLRPLLSRARSYVRSYYSHVGTPGSVREDGARCEDITRLTLPDASLDLIVSSDVLEHVPDVLAAFRETARVLRPGGAHLFTVPPRAATRPRAEIRGGEVVHLLPPEYHGDPLDPRGILTYWEFGPDAPSRFRVEGIELSVVDGPLGKDQRVIWRALRLPG